MFIYIRNFFIDMFSRLFKKKTPVVRKRKVQTPVVRKRKVQTPVSQDETLNNVLDEKFTAYSDYFDRSQNNILIPESFTIFLSSKSVDAFNENSFRLFQYMQKNRYRSTIEVVGTKWYLKLYELADALKKLDSQTSEDVKKDVLEYVVKAQKVISDIEPKMTEAVITLCNDIPKEVYQIKLDSFNLLTVESKSTILRKIPHLSKPDKTQKYTIPIEMSAGLNSSKTTVYIPTHYKKLANYLVNARVFELEMIKHELQQVFDLFDKL